VTLLPFYSFIPEILSTFAKQSNNFLIMIIQRWQSLLLLIASVMMAIFTFDSLGQFQLSDNTLEFHTWGIALEGIPADGAKSFSVPTVYLLVVSVLSSLLYFIDIFLFKNTRKQKHVLLISILATIATIATAALVGYTAIEGAVAVWSLTAVAPFIAVITGIFAYRCIKSDEEKIRSYDRLR